MNRDNENGFKSRQANTINVRNDRNRNGNKKYKQNYGQNYSQNYDHNKNNKYQHHHNYKSHSKNRNHTCIYRREINELKNKVEYMSQEIDTLRNSIEILRTRYIPNNFNY